MEDAERFSLSLFDGLIKGSRIAQSNLDSTYRRNVDYQV